MTATVPGSESLPVSPRLPLVLESAQLFSQGNEVRIRHGGDEYRLRITSNNKLILTK